MLADIVSSVADDLGSRRRHTLNRSPIVYAFLLAFNHASSWMSLRKSRRRRTRVSENHSGSNVGRYRSRQLRGGVMHKLAALRVTRHDNLGARALRERLLHQRRPAPREILAGRLHIQ